MYAVVLFTTALLGNGVRATLSELHASRKSGSALQCPGVKLDAVSNWELPLRTSLPRRGSSAHTALSKLHACSNAGCALKVTLSGIAVAAAAAGRDFLPGSHVGAMLAGCALPSSGYAL